MITVRELWRKLQASEESVTIEAKTGNQIGVDEKRTISAFSNSRGGYLLLGISESQNPKEYLLSGVKNVEQIQNDLATQCRTNFNVQIRPEIEVDVLEGKNIVSVYIPPSPASHRPVYIKALGVNDGSFIRVGASDQKCTDDDIAELYAQRNSLPYDESIVSRIGIDVINPDAIEEYRRMRKLVDPEAAELTMNDTDLLISLDCAHQIDGVLHPTVGGLLLFGSGTSLKRVFPIHRVDYIRIIGTKWAAPTEESPHYSIELNEGIFTMLPKLLSAVMDDIPRVISIPKNSMIRNDDPIIPLRVVREALVNMVMHRDYTKLSPCQVIRYSDRIEFRNIGSSLKDEVGTGLPGSAVRNPTLSRVLHETKYSENRGYGVGMMIEQMKSANLPSPEFISSPELKTFVLILSLNNNKPIEEKESAKKELSDREWKIIRLIQENPAITITEISEKLGLTTRQTRELIDRLKDNGSLKRDGSKKSGIWIVSLEL